MNKKLKEKLGNFYREEVSKNRQHCYCAHHEDATDIMTALVKHSRQLENCLIMLHRWCQGNIESGCEDITPFCVDVRNAIEAVGIASSQEGQVDCDICGDYHDVDCVPLSCQTGDGE